MPRGSWVVFACSIVWGPACGREPPVEAAGAPAAVEEPVVEESAKGSGVAGEAKAVGSARPDRDTKTAVAPVARAEPDAAAPAEVERPAPIEPGPMSRDEPEPRVLLAPPLGYTLYAEAPVKQGPRPTLVQLSAERNAIIDEAAWFTKHGLALPIWDVGGRAFGSAGDPLPPEIPMSFKGGRLVQAIRGVGCSIAIYGLGYASHHLVVRDEAGDALGAFDFSAYAHVPGDGGHGQQDIAWAHAQDGVLLVSTRHMGYASESGGLNAFITAIELGSGQLLWRSEPLVSNSHDFLVLDGWIFTGYGFTAEPDFLFVLDMKTGEVVEKTKVKSGPEVILEKGGRIFVRTYDRDYEFLAKAK
jgi:hypothetical protein